MAHLHAVAGDGIDGDPLPHNINAEQAVIGAAMLSPAALADARAVLDGSEFYRPAHQVIWQAICTLADRGDPHDPLSVGARLGPSGLSRSGGAPYLHTLLAAVPSAANAGYFANLVRDLAYARDVLAAGQRLAQAAMSATGDASTDLRAKVAAETAALAETGRRGWPDPVPLSSAPEVPAFPVWALPEWLGEYAACLAEVTQTPADLAGSLALTVLSVAAAGKVWIDTGMWTEPSCLYTVTVLPPGNRKSEVFRAMTAPLRDAEQTMIEAARPVIAEALVRRKVAEAEADRTAKVAAAAAADRGSSTEDAGLAMDTATTAKMDLDSAIVPAEPSLFADDITVERLATRIAEQNGRYAVLSPEGEILSIAAGRYSGAPNLGVLKAGHAGEQIRVERMGRVERVENACLTIGLCTQPGVLQRLGDTAQFREQGLLARLLFSVPESTVGYRNPSPDPMPATTRDLYTTTVAALTLSLAALEGPRVLSHARCCTGRHGPSGSRGASFPSRWRPLAYV